MRDKASFLRLWSCNKRILHFFFEKQLGPEHLIAAETLHNIALVHRKQGRHNLKAECFDKCMVIYAKVYGNVHGSKQQGLVPKLAQS